MTNLNLNMEKQMVNVTMEMVAKLATLHGDRIEDLDKRNLNVYKKAVAFAISDYKDIFKLDENDQFFYITLGALTETTEEAYEMNLVEEVLASEGL